MRIRSWPFLAVLMTMVLVTACGGSDEPEAGDEAAGDPTEQSVEEQAPTEEEGTEDPGAEATATEESAPADGAGAELDTEDPFEIVFVSGLTGPLADAAGGALGAVESAAEVLNQASGVLGREVTVEGLDSGGDPTQAVTVLQERLSSGDAPDLVFAGVSSAETLAMLPILTRNEIASFANSSNPSIDSPEEYPFHFGTAPTAAGQLAALPGFLEENDVESLSLLLPEDAFGDGNAQALAEVLDIEFTEHRFSTDDVDLSVAYERALVGDPDAVYLDCFGDACGRLLDARVAVGATDLLTIAGSGVSGTAGGPAEFSTPDAIENLFMHVFDVQEFQSAEERTEAFAEFFDTFSADNPTDVSILPIVLAYEGTRAYAMAAEAAGSAEASALAEAMTALGEPDSGWIVYPSGPGYTVESHFPDATAEVFSYIPPGPLEDGMFSVDG